MVETIRLESGHTLTGIGGSNPSLSASIPQILNLAFSCASSTENDFKNEGLRHLSIDAGLGNPCAVG